MYGFRYEIGKLVGKVNLGASWVTIHCDRINKVFWSTRVMKQGDITIKFDARDSVIHCLEH